MSGEFIYVVHRCVLPKILKRYGKGTLWQCNTCSKDWQIIWICGEPQWRTADYNCAMTSYRNHKGWKRKPPAPIWNEQEQRME